MKARRRFAVCVNMHTHSTWRDHLALLYLAETKGGEGSCPRVHSSEVCLLLSSFHLPGKVESPLCCGDLGVDSQAAEPLGRVVSFWAGTFFSWEVKCFRHPLPSSENRDEFEANTRAASGSLYFTSCGSQNKYELTKSSAVANPVCSLLSGSLCG